MLPIPPRALVSASGTAVAPPGNSLAVVRHSAVPHTDAGNFHAEPIDVVESFAKQVGRVVDAIEAAEMQYRIAASTGQLAVEESRRLHEHLPLAMSMLTSRCQARYDMTQFHDVRQFEKLTIALKNICDLLMSSIHLLDKECAEVDRLQSELHVARDRRQKRRLEWDRLLQATRSDMAAASETFRGMLIPAAQKITEVTSDGRPCKVARW